MANPPRTVMELLRLATQHLAGSGIDTARLDAEILLGSALGLPRIQLYVQFDRPLQLNEVAAYRTLIARRARREPIAYILQEREFRSLPLKVDSRVLVPRPETEHLVEEALEELIGRYGAAEPVRVADIGTGSGAVAIALAKAREALTVVATDIASDALAVARENVLAHALADRIELREGDLMAPLAGERFHGILSNPPYIREHDWATLPPDVRLYEPKGALVGGKDGLDHIRRLIAGADRHLDDRGFLAIEIGADQGEAVAALAVSHGYESFRIAKDLAGRDRVAIMSRVGGFA